MEWLKTFYETVGTPYPKASLVIVMVLAALVAGATWIAVGKQVEKDKAAAAPPQITGPASTTGANSPANTGSGNTFSYDQSAPKEPKKDKP